MSPGKDARVVEFLLERLGSDLQGYAADASTAIIGVIGPAAASLLVIYVLLWGVAIASGQISEPFTDGMKRILWMCVIIAVALTAGVYQDVVVDFFEQVPAELAKAMHTSGGKTVTDAESLAPILDDCIGKALGLGNAVWDNAVALNQLSLLGMTAEGLMLQLLAVILYLSALLAVGIAAATIFVANMGLALLLAVGPLFIVLALFPQTRRWFEAWLGQAVRFVVLFVIIAIVSGLIFPLLGGYYQSLTQGSFAEQALVNALKGIGVSIAVACVLVQLYSIATAIGQGAVVRIGDIGARLSGRASGAAPVVVHTAAPASGAAALPAAAGGGRPVRDARAAVGRARRMAVQRGSIGEV